MLYDDTFMDSYPVLTPGDMRRTEKKAFDLGVPSLLLMEHAAIAVTDELEKALGGDCRRKQVLFLCGRGNNGGDGLAAARLFLQRGGRPAVWLYGEPKTPDAALQLRWLKALLGEDEIVDLSCLSREQWPMKEEGPDKPYDGYVDALLGTGFRGDVDELMARMMLVPSHDFHLPAAGTRMPPVIALDIPSGIDGKTGKCAGTFVHADVTVTFHAPKPGLYLTPEREAVGKIVVADIGLWSMAPWNCDSLWLEDPELDCEVLTPKALCLRPRPINAHKGDCGRILVYAGSLGMAGAAAMCAKAAVTAGAGLTTVACDKEIMPILQTLVPNAMCVDIQKAVDQPPPYDVLALGCGLGQSDGIWQNMIRLWNPDKPSVWDADALNLLARHPMKLGQHAVITPHVGEAARLLGCSVEEILDDRLAAARKLAETYGCTAVLKSDVSVICGISEGKPVYRLNAVGSPALAKGGSGDALAGILAVLLHGCNGMPLFPAADACLWHGMASLAGAKEYGVRELTADQLISCLAEAERTAQAGNWV